MMPGIGVWIATGLARSGLLVETVESVVVTHPDRSAALRITVARNGRLPGAVARAGRARL